VKVLVICRPRPGVAPPALPLAREGLIELEIIELHPFDGL